jgi:hypothetical protein
MDAIIHLKSVTAGDVFNRYFIASYWTVAWICLFFINRIHFSLLCHE